MKTQTENCPVDAFVAGGAIDPEWSGPQPGAAEDPEGDRVQEGQGARLGSLWDRLQGDDVWFQHISACYL